MAFLTFAKKLKSLLRYLSTGSLAKAKTTNNIMHFVDTLEISKIVWAK
jgi:hypothetical protein